MTVMNVWGGLGGSLWINNFLSS